MVGGVMLLSAFIASVLKRRMPIYLQSEITFTSMASFNSSVMTTDKNFHSVNPVSQPRLEQRTFCVLDRCDNQLRH
ncbi:hypothetical protein K443DRAFT_171473 [Laccaria amethystina LaAM-08-1]|uniref:Uncharacterized protein n=1 Tax=Laccaria amethystina LaAM-08-1 TaxID=1095629 RepID=A0A0C9XU88_9AGAR|nr:hypothetical protein K443DRAFT_171473 [Laccaria amethystina LaAM-08-1]